MATIQPNKGPRGTSYRVQFMRNGRRASKTFKLKKDAEKFLAKVTLDDDFVDSLTNKTLHSITLNEAISEFMEQYTGKDPSFSQRLDFWRKELGDKPIGKITRREVKAGLAKLQKRGLAPSTQNRHKANLSRIFVYLSDSYDIRHNPCREVRQKAEDNARTRFLSSIELERLLKAAAASKWDRLYLLVLMAVTTGARRSEMVGLKWSDIDFADRRAHIATTKNGEPRVLPLTEDVAAELNRFREVGAGYVFPHPSDLGRRFRNFDCYWRPAVAEAQLTDFRFHDLRHTAASILAMNGASLLEIAQVLGHKSITMTQRYSHLCTSHKAKLIDRVFGGVAHG